MCVSYDCKYKVIAKSDLGNEFNATVKVITSSTNRPFNIQNGTKDTIKPELTVPTVTVRAMANKSLGVPVEYPALANDNVDGQIKPTCVPPSGSIFRVGYTTVTCTPVDRAGNAALASFVITVMISNTNGGEAGTPSMGGGPSGGAARPPGTPNIIGVPPPPPTTPENQTTLGAIEHPTSQVLLQISPANGTIFNSYPRTTTLEWSNVGLRDTI